MIAHLLKKQSGGTSGTSQPAYPAAVNTNQPAPNMPSTPLRFTEQ